MNALAMIFARGGSKGVKDKNLRSIGGQSLIERAVRSALASKYIDNVIVSTDDSRIAEAARRTGAEVPFLRPKHLALDDSPEWHAWQHALLSLRDRWESGDVFVSVPTTSPLRHATDIDRCVERFAEGEADAVITLAPAKRNPHFNMVALDATGAARLVVGEGRVVRRQDAPRFYEVTTVAYALRPEFVLSAEGLFDGRVVGVEVPFPRSLDIDDDWDLVIAEHLLEHQAKES